MITKEELLKIGFVEKGVEENDVFYQMVLDGSIFGIYFLSGNLKNGIFNLYNNNKYYTDMNHLIKLFEVCEFIKHKL